MNLLIVANAPGEITTWVKPVVQAIHKESREVKITCLLPFCQFASGKEVDLLKEIPGIDIIPTKSYLRTLIRGQSCLGTRSQKGVVFHLGGDPFHSLVLARRFGWKVAIYSYKSTFPFLKYFDKIMVLDGLSRERAVARGVKRGQIETVGDLIVDSVNESSQTREELCQRYSLRTEEVTIGILAGSREEHIRHLLPFLLRVAELIKEELKEIQFVTLIATSIKLGFLKETLSLPLSSFLDGSTAEIQHEDGGITLLTDQGLRVPVVRGDPEVMRICHIVLTIPGSNTGQLASLGVPMLVLVPLNAPEFIPLEGIWGLVDRIPLIGCLLKRFFVRCLNERIIFTALPNIRAKKFVVPEIRGVLHPIDVAQRALEYLQELNIINREEISGQLQGVMGSKGASKRVARIILSMLGPEIPSLKNN